MTFAMTEFKNSVITTRRFSLCPLFRHLIMMELPFLVLSAIAVKLASAWECHPDCSGYAECLAENARRNGGRRELESELKNDVVEDTLPAVDIQEPVKALTNLRGTINEGNTDRELQIWYFQIKMYWENWFCVSDCPDSCCRVAISSLVLYELISSFSSCWSYSLVAGGEARKRVVLAV